LSKRPIPRAVFTEGSTMRHVIVMTAATSVGLMAIFVVDLLSLLYVSWLGDPKLTAAVGFASQVLFFSVSINIGLSIAIAPSGAQYARKHHAEAKQNGGRKRDREIGRGDIECHATGAEEDQNLPPQRPGGAADQSRDQNDMNKTRCRKPPCAVSISLAMRPRYKGADRD